VPLAGLLWLLAGGIAYTVGVAFLAANEKRYSHFIWHLLVLVGSGCHVIAVLSYSTHTPVQ
jgi:hemolysin III